MKKRVAVLISGNGSNLQALINAAKKDDFPAQIAVVISNQSGVFGLERASKAGIPTVTLPHKDYADRNAFDAALHKLICEHAVDIVCLAGFMRILTPAFVGKWKDRMLNIHPSLLPSYPGLHTHEKALKDGIKIHGCSVHLVSEDLDGGPIIIQAAVPVLNEDTPDTLAQRVLTAEHQIYPQALRWLAEGIITVKNGAAFINSTVVSAVTFINPALD